MTSQCARDRLLTRICKGSVDLGLFSGGNFWCDQPTTDYKLTPFVKKTKEGGLDLAGTMQSLASSLGNLSPLEQTRALKGPGFNLRDVVGVEILINRVKGLRGVENDLDNSRGEAERLAGVRMSAADEQWANLMQNLDLLRATIS
jgi:hypothetical protein